MTKQAVPPMNAHEAAQSVYVYMAQQKAMFAITSAKEIASREGYQVEVQQLHPERTQRTFRMVAEAVADCWTLEEIKE